MTGKLELDELARELVGLAKTYSDVRKAAKSVDKTASLASIEKRVDAIEQRIVALREEDPSLPHPILDDNPKLATLRDMVAKKQAEGARLKRAKASPLAPKGIVESALSNVHAEIERLTRLIRDEEALAWDIGG